MNNYSEIVARLVDNYLDRMKAQLGSVPTRERDDFLLEIRSHIFESYLQADGDDDVAKILSVLAKLGEPAEVVSERLSETMVRSGAKRKLPLHIIAGVLIALFGIPLGFGGVAVLAGVLIALAGVVVSFYATAAAIFLVSTMFLILGLTRIYEPAVWDRLITNGVIQMNGPLAGFLDQLSPAGQGTLMIMLAAVFAACGLGMLWLGKYMTRGLRFLSTLVLDWIRKLASRARHTMIPKVGEALHFIKVPLNGPS